MKSHVAGRSLRGLLLSAGQCASDKRTCAAATSLFQSRCVELAVSAVNKFEYQDGGEAVAISAYDDPQLQKSRSSLL